MATSPVDTLSDATGSADPAEPLVETASAVTSGTVEAVSDTTSDPAAVISDTTTMATSSVDAVWDATTSVTEAAAVSSATSSDATEASDPTWSGAGSTQTSEQSYSGDSASAAGWQAPSQRALDERIILLAADRDRAGATLGSQVEQPGPCPDTDSLLCALTIGVSGVGSLVKSVASVIRYLAFTGFAVLPWLAASFMLAIAGALAVTESRRRMQFQNLG
jgi:type IV secretory pathway TrbD component